MAVKTLDKETKRDIAAKAENEGQGYYLQNYAASDFEGTEYEERIKKLEKDLNWFDHLMFEFGADEEEEES